jgi:zinc finger protein
MLCPVCGRKLEVKTTAYNAFDKILLISILCECGFKHTDSIVAEIKEPMRFTVKVKKDNLFTKVIRSTSGTIRIPEIGVSIEPGPASQAFITNLEGVLARVEDIVRVAKLWSDDFEKVKRCNWILERIRNTIEGEEELTLILEDPFGNSIILGNAVQEPIDEKEALSLKTGLHNGLR